jgi:hypothetical protein
MKLPRLRRFAKKCGEQARLDLERKLTAQAARFRQDRRDTDSCVRAWERENLAYPPGAEPKVSRREQRLRAAFAEILRLVELLPPPRPTSRSDLSPLDAAALEEAERWRDAGFQGGISLDAINWLVAKRLSGGGLALWHRVSSSLRVFPVRPDARTDPVDALIYEVALLRVAVRGGDEA